MQLAQLARRGQSAADATSATHAETAAVAALKATSAAARAATQLPTSLRRVQLEEAGVSPADKGKQAMDELIQSGE